MIALIRIELDEEHLAKETNEIYDRLQGYNSALIPLPEKKETDSTGTIEEYMLKGYDRGWNACLDEITGESNG